MAAVSSRRDIMVMLSLICSYDSFGISCGPLNMLTNIASCTGAFVIAPVDINNALVFSQKAMKQNAMHENLIAVEYSE
jgi:hypothetical protein